MYIYIYTHGTVYTMYIMCRWYEFLLHTSKKSARPRCKFGAVEARHRGQREGNPTHGAERALENSCLGQLLTAGDVMRKGDAFEVKVLLGFFLGKNAKRWRDTWGLLYIAFWYSYASLYWFPIFISLVILRKVSSTRRRGGRVHYGADFGGLGAGHNVSKYSIVSTSIGMKICIDHPHCSPFCKPRFLEHWYWVLV